MGAPFALLYDADCASCMTVAVALLDLDRHGRLRAVAIQDREGQRLLPGRTPEERLQSFHLVDPDGTVTSGGAALPRLFAQLPAGAPLRAVLAARLGLTDRCYRFVAVHRMQISRALPGRLKRRARRRLGRPGS